MSGTLIFHFLKENSPDFTSSSFKTLVARQLLPGLLRLQDVFIREGFFKDFKLDKYEFVFV